MSQHSLTAVRVLLTMESLAAEPELGVTELGKQFGWSKASVHRILQALVETGYAEQVPETEKYRLTTKLFRIGSAVIHRTGLTQAALPVMEDLFEKTRETINLAILDGSDVVYVQKIETEALIGENIRVGSRFPAHCTALGKVLLADLPEHALDELLGGMELVQRTPNTITQEQALREALSSIRQRGYAVDREELSLGLQCVAAPIRDSSGKAIAALSVSGPVTRRTDDDLPLLGELLIEAVSSISGNLGYFDGKWS
jgi:DNA-binding IclR family transcriptional regulator